MHIPDGFLDGKTAALTGVLSVAGVGLALRQVKRTLPPRQVPLLGLSAAFLFAAQMVNFPVAGGTSGHLLGGVLVAALLGPSAAIVVVTTVLIVQCFLFADGGVLALGANIFNMAIVGAVGGYAVLRGVNRLLPGERGRITAVVFAGWCSAVVASMVCAGELAWSGTVGWNAAFTAMVGVHMLIGIGEGLISTLVFQAVQRTRPDLVLASSEPLVRRGGAFWVYGLLAALGVAVFVAPFACTWPDGLDSVAEKLGFGQRAHGALLFSPMPDYKIAGIHWTVGSTALAGALGALIVFALAWLLGRKLVKSPAPGDIAAPRT